MPARNLLILIATTVVSLLCYRTAARNHYGGLLAGAIGEINETYVRPVDVRQLFDGAMHGMVRQLDPYSDYISPKELAEFQEDLDQEFGGVGIVVEINEETGWLTVLSPLPDTPAFAAGIGAGDEILAIDGESTQGLQIREAVDLMRGEPGTSLSVTVLHAGADEPVELTLQRAIIPIASVLGDLRNADGSWQFTLTAEPRMGYIRLASFGEQTAAELNDAVASLLPQIDGLILDLRGNGGGLLDSAISICNLFIDDGVIVSIRGRDPARWQDYVAAPELTQFGDLPLVLLVDGFSASASEITAACLQDHKRAIVVGQRTWGKGTVQNVMPFEGGRSALKLTVATYWRPSGQNIHRDATAGDDDGGWGVSPNPGYEVKLTDEEYRQLVQARRQRDFLRKTIGDDDDEVADAKGEPQESSGAADDPPEFVDPQLQRAVEALREQLTRPADAAQNLEGEESAWRIPQERAR